MLTWRMLAQGPRAGNPPARGRARPRDLAPGGLAAEGLAAVNGGLHAAVRPLAVELAPLR